jgi:L-threonylcarbamoyladenylate synthase
VSDPDPTVRVKQWPEDVETQGATAEQAADILRDGGLVVYPTDTVYGLGADAARPDAIDRIYQVKGRPDEKAIIWLVSSIDDVESVCIVDAWARLLADEFWPGPLTLVLQRRNPSQGQLPTLGVRIPRHAAALAIIRANRGPVATTSANRSGEPSARNVEEAIRQIGNDVDLIIDAGASPVGQESTVLDLTGDPPVILRAGALSPDQISLVLGRPVSPNAS